jgi:DNA-binding Lrp family transcriptional regulator
MFTAIASTSTAGFASHQVRLGESGTPSLVYCPEPGSRAQCQRGRRVRVRYDAVDVRDARPALRARLMDDIDARIVAFLVRDARASYALIGGEVGLSAPAVKRRVDRLRAAGAITGFSARVDPAAMGWTTEAYVELYCGGRTSPEEIGAAVRRYPEVVDACTITGEADALVHIRAADVRHFEDVMERIRAESFVVRTKSVIVLSRLVDRADVLAPLR